jgi:hypothetical protein
MVSRVFLTSNFELRTSTSILGLADPCYVIQPDISFSSKGLNTNF